MTSSGGYSNLNDPLNLPLAFKAWLLDYVAQQILVSQFTGYKAVFTAPGVVFQSGVGSPEGVVVAPIGSLYTRTNGGAATTLYVKESGTGNTGWIAK